MSLGEGNKRDNGIEMIGREGKRMMEEVKKGPKEGKDGWEWERRILEGHARERSEATKREDKEREGIFQSLLKKKKARLLQKYICNKLNY